MHHVYKCTPTLCTFWGLGITPKTPSGRHASLVTMQQSQRVTLRQVILLNEQNGCNKPYFL